MINYNMTGDLNNVILNNIYGYYVRYDTLVPLINRSFKGSRATVIDIFIDIHDIFHKTGKYLNNTEISSVDPLVFVSGIVNMVAHYRNLFTTRYNCASRFWLIDSVDNVLAKKYVMEFKAPQLSPHMMGIYKTAITFLPTVCKYIPDVHYERTSVDIVTKTIALKEQSGSVAIPTILISKDPFVFQACAAANIWVLRPKKHGGSDISILMDFNTASSAYIEAVSYKRTTVRTLHANCLALLMGMTRVPSRSLRSSFNIPSAVNRIYNYYEQYGGNDMVPYWVLDVFINRLLEVHPKSKADPFKLKMYIQACDTVFTQMEAYRLLPEYKTYNGVVNLYDPEGMREINDKYFKKYPLDLNVL